MANELTRPTLCYPAWHVKFWPLTLLPQVTLSSGCALNAQGNIACAPEAMRAAAEAQLKQLVPGLFPGALSLETYTLARYMESEIGSGTIEERVAVGEAAVNQAKLRGKTILNVLLYNQNPTHPNYGFYGPIHGPAGITTAPYRRWASTRRDPTILTLLLAELVTSGQSQNFANGADDQADYFAREAFANPVATLQRQATQGTYWVGPLPGVNHRKTFLMRKFGLAPTTPEGATLLARGIAAVTGKMAPPPADLPICAPATTPPSSSHGRQILISALLVGGLIGASWLTLRVVRGVTPA